jgi:hypothetical protein
VLKLDANGNHLSSQLFGKNGDQLGNALALDSAGGLIVAGDFTGSIDFGGSTPVSAGGYDVFLAKILP